MGIDWKDRFEKNIPPTKGPWHWEDWGGAAALVGPSSGDGFALAGVQHAEVSVADADLIAAAPELRDALEWALDKLAVQGLDFVDTNRENGRYYVARALLERLKGQGASG